MRPVPRTLTLLGLLALTATLFVTTPARIPTGSASSHRESPLLAFDPLADNTDVYAFVSPDRPDTVTIIANWIPLEAPPSGPEYYRFGDDILYKIHLDHNGDAEEDLTWEFRFTTTVANPNTFVYNTGPVASINDPNLAIRQTYQRDEKLRSRVRHHNI